MKAVTIKNFGAPSVLEISEIDTPKPGKDQVLVKIHASAVNPMDWKIRQFGTGKKLDKPLVLGMDMAGEIVIPDASAEFKEGDKVYGYIDTAIMGCYAEYAAVPASNIAIMPKNISFEEAASLPVSCITAIEGLYVKHNLKEGEKVLIHAAAGGVGVMAVQLARLSGATVYATASSRNHEFLSKLGVHECIDYNTVMFDEALSDLDVVFEAIGGDVQKRSHKVLKKGGSLVSITDIPDKEVADQYDINVYHVWAHPNKQMLNKVTQLVEGGVLEPVIGKAFTLEDIKQAHVLSETGHARGKIVVTI
ncbi:NADP-dependent oxidoreductase [Roseivirga sp. BDSF3-8]|uniref:NADP-dependent oxidoreductase n=1 Tax=Roseivirga sp. BDSF3-8 TaxID=3241598 RepID=UPI0035326142